MFCIFMPSVLPLLPWNSQIESLQDSFFSSNRHIGYFLKLFLMTAVDHLVLTEVRGMKWDTLSMPGSVSQGEYLAVEKMGFHRSSLFLAVVFWSIPYVSGGVLFLGHSFYFPPSSSSNSKALIQCGISLPPTVLRSTHWHCQDPL